MSMEKRGVVNPRQTNDTEDRKPAAEKRAGDRATTEALDDDFTKRAADQAADSLKSNGS